MPPPDFTIDQGSEISRSFLRDAYEWPLQAEFNSSPKSSLNYRNCGLYWRFPYGGDQPKTQLEQPMTTASIPNSVLPKLAHVRAELRKADLKMTGRNTYSDYDYFELKDFLPKALDLMEEVQLFSHVSYAADVATLTITDWLTGHSLTWTSPMSEANLKAAHPIQNLGAVETYERRYLYMAALEIMEPSASDKKPPEEPKGRTKEGAGKALPTYTEAQFKKNLSTWLTAILVDKTHTKEQIIAQIMTKHAWPADYTGKLEQAIEKAREKMASEGGEA